MPLYDWMSPVYTQHKERMLCQTKEVSICTIHLDAPYVGMPPISLDAAICLPVCLDTPMCFNASVCLDAPKAWIPPCLDVTCTYTKRMLYQTKGVSICPHTCGCPLYIHNTKKRCFVRLRACPYAPIQLDVPICLDAPCMLEHPHMFGCPLYIHKESHVLSD